MNAAIEEVAAYAEANLRLIGAARDSNIKLSGAERKRATVLLHDVAVSSVLCEANVGPAVDHDANNCAWQTKEGVKGRHWFLDNDLKSGTSLKLDKTGKAMMTLLRHLGRLSEVFWSL